MLLSIEEILRDLFKKNRKKYIPFTRKRVIEIKKRKRLFLCLYDFESLVTYIEMQNRNNCNIPEHLIWYVFEIIEEKKTLLPQNFRNGTYSLQKVEHLFF